MDTSNAVLVGFGGDSFVYDLGNSSVLKLYDRLMREVDCSTGKTLSESKGLKLLQAYNRDTLKASEILASKWHTFSEDNKKLRLDSDLYDIVIKILPQGESRTLTKLTLPVQRGFIQPERDIYLISVGQKYISTPNMQDIFSSGNVTLHEQFYQKKSNIESIFYNISDVLSNELRINFKVVACNVKPALDESDKKITLTITDLANSLTSSYHKLLS